MNNEHTHATIGFIFFCLTIMVLIISVTKNQTVSEYLYCAKNTTQSKIQVCFKEESDRDAYIKGNMYISYEIPLVNNSSQN